MSSQLRTRFSLDGIIHSNKSLWTPKVVFNFQPMVQSTLDSDRKTGQYFIPHCRIRVILRQRFSQHTIFNLTWKYFCWKHQYNILLLQCEELECLKIYQIIDPSFDSDCRWYLNIPPWVTRTPGGLDLPDNKKKNSTSPGLLSYFTWVSVSMVSSEVSSILNHN